MAQMVFPDQSVVDILTTLIAAAGGFFRVCPFINDFTPTRNTLLTDFVQPDPIKFITEADVGPWLPGVAPDNSIFACIPANPFISVDPTYSVSIFGVFVLDAGSNLIFSARFDDPPINIFNTLQFLLVSGGYGFAGAGFVNPF